MELVETSLAPGILKADGKPIELHGTGARRCECVAAREREKRRTAALAIIPSRYASVTLATLRPDPLRHPKQTALVAALKQNPDKSYFLCGRPDTGKSHFFWALYRSDVDRDIPVFASKLLHLIAAIKAEMFDDGPQALPDLTRNRVNVYLDDVNKARPTEFVAERFFDFLDDIYNRQYKLVVTSQLPPEDLIHYYNKDVDGIRVVDGGAIVRRMANDETADWRMF